MRRGRVAGLVAACVLAATAGTAAAAKPALVSAPAVTGGTVVGASQSAMDGTWSGAPSLGRSWLRCDDHGNGCVPIGSSAATRQLVHEDGGRSLRIEVTATNADGSVVAQSLPTDVIGEAPVNVAAPSNAGTAIVGQTLETDDGVWWGYPVPIVSRSWQQCDAAGTCTDVPYGGERAYRVRHTDVGRRLRVRVSVASILGTQTAWSAQSTVVPPAAPLAMAPPSVPAAPVVGATAAATAATWEGADQVRRLWERCDDAEACTPIRSASGLQYVVTAADLGMTLRLTETATNSVGASHTTSGRTGRVVAPDARSLALLLRTLVPISGSRMAIRVRCALDQPGIRTCAASLSLGRTVLTRAAVSTASRTATSVTVRLPVTPALRRVAKRPAGRTVTLTARATQDAHDGESWSATRTLLASPASALTEPARPLFGGSRARLRPTADLQRLRTAVADASSLVCTGHTAASGKPARDLALGLARARAVCAWLARGRSLTTLARSSGSYRPIAGNATRKGRARNDRVTVQVGYWRPDPALERYRA